MSGPFDFTRSVRVSLERRAAVEAVLSPLEFAVWRAGNQATLLALLKQLDAPPAVLRTTRRALRRALAESARLLHESARDEG